MILIDLGKILLALFMLSPANCWADSNQGTTSQVKEYIQVIQAVAPNYPALATIAGISATVTVEVTVNERGEVIATKILQGHKLLNQSFSVEIKDVSPVGKDVNAKEKE